MSPDEIYLANFPFGGSAGMKLRPVLLLTGPIGSGPTESECKTTTQRFKGRGRRWNSANAEAMMALACLDDSRMWQTYWTTPKPAKT